MILYVFGTLLFDIFVNWV